MNDFSRRRGTPPAFSLFTAGVTVAACALFVGNGHLRESAAEAAGPKKTSGAPRKSAPPKPSTAARASNGPVFVDNTPLTDEQKIIHVLDRLGFGPRPGDVERVRQMGLNRYVEQQLQPTTMDDAAVESKLAGFTAMHAAPQELTQAYEEGRQKAREIKKRMASAQAGGGEMAAAGAPGTMPGSENAMEAQRRMRGGTGRGQALALVVQANQQMQMAKVARAVESERQLNEVLVDFWSNHFNIDQRKNLCRFLKVVDEREVIRPNVLGKFRDLLGASAHSPAMLIYLDNAQSQVAQPVNPRLTRMMQERARRSGDPLMQAAVAQKMPAPGQKTRGGINENYAREIMELHTLGVDGGYTQKDVQEVARCFTGWGVDRQTGTFQFNRRRHDDGEKLVLGRVIPADGGIKDGEMVLDILASHPSTAKFLSRQLCQRFVSDEPPAALVSRCAQVWQKTNGDLREVVRTIVTSPEFFSRAAYRQKIKSPFEFAVSSVRALGGTVDMAGGRRRIGRGMRAAAGGGGGKGGYQNALRQTLAGQIATMGQPLYQYQAPTGYSEDSRKWVSSGALISRLNFTLGLVSGKVPEIRIAPPAAPNAAPADTLNVLADRLLGGEMSPATRATLLKQATAAPTDAASPAQDTTTAMRLTALVLGSPEFQRR